MMQVGARAIADPTSLVAICGLKLGPRGPSYTLVRLLEGMQASSLRVSVHAPLNEWPGPLPFPVTTGLRGVAAERLRLPYSLAKRELKRSSERRLLRQIGTTGARQIVFTWGEIALPTSEALAARGHFVVREKFNCAKAVADEILREAYARLGVTSPGFDEAVLAKEARELGLADAVFCPSPMVAKSLVEIGIDPAKLIETSYGWEPARFAGESVALAPLRDGLTILFVGYACVRKGAHLLLQAWEEAKIRGRLVLVGTVEPIIRERYAHVLGREDVVSVPYTNDVASYYRSADWFIFPTLEEGGPQVTYEAAGCGVPLLVSPMGAGAFGRDGVEGIVLDSAEVGPWTDLLRSLSDRGEERERYAAAAREHALSFTYDQVGARRREALLDHFTASVPSKEEASSRV